MVQWYGLFVLIDARKQTERLDYLLSGIKGGMQSKDENRYAVCKAAMALFARHANLFRPVH
jgi:hypothetical protein